MFFGDPHYYKQVFSNSPQVIYQFMQIYNLLNAFWKEPQNEHVYVINKVSLHLPTSPLEPKKK